MAAIADAAADAATTSSGSSCFCAAVAAETSSANPHHHLNCCGHRTFFCQSTPSAIPARPRAGLGSFYLQKRPGPTPMARCRRDTAKAAANFHILQQPLYSLLTLYYHFLVLFQFCIPCWGGGFCVFGDGWFIGCWGGLWQPLLFCLACCSSTAALKHSHSSSIS